jgi:Zn finger protein HypA/HybF involved in hydrogenase expression
MNAIDVVTMVGVAGVLGVQLGAPLWLAWREIHAPAAPKQSAEHTKGAKPNTKDTPALPALAPLRCPSCKAPVPLLAKQFACPHCAATVVPPDDYVGALAARSKSDTLLARAERMWRRSRIVCARPTTFLMTILSIAWTVVVIMSSYKAFDYGVPGPILGLPILMAVVQCLLGFFLISVIGDGRKELPPVPARAELRVPALEGTCTGCSGPFVFDKDRLASTCRYCGAENFRAALAHKAHVHEARGETTASASMMEQIKAHDARRHEMLSFFAFIGIAEVFYAVLLPIGWLVSLLDFL